MVQYIISYVPDAMLNILQALYNVIITAPREAH